MIVKAAAILFMIVLSGCTDEFDKSDPPAIGLAAEPATVAPSEPPAESVVPGPPAPDSRAEAKNEPPMRYPVQLD